MYYITISEILSTKITIFGNQLYFYDFSPMYFFKGTVSLISSDPSCKDDNTRFTTVPLKSIWLIMFFKFKSVISQDPRCKHDNSPLYTKALLQKKSSTIKPRKTEKSLRVPLWIENCHLCMGGELKITLTDPFLSIYN